MNRKVAEEGLKNDYGMKVGKTLMKSIKEGLMETILCLIQWQ